MNWNLEGRVDEQKNYLTQNWQSDTFDYNRSVFLE